jgi:hypothetical protein
MISIICSAGRKFISKKGISGPKDKVAVVVIMMMMMTATTNLTATTLNI